MPVSVKPPTRPAFRDGQVLRAADLREESAAVGAAAVHHQEYAHRPGIVAGLWLTGSGGTATVSPGMAVDAHGRSILVSEEHSFTPPTAPSEVWIAFAENAVSSNRSADGYEILFERNGQYDPANPSGHPQGAIFLGAWPSGSDPSAGRVYVGAVGARVEAASRRGRLLLGPEGPTDLRLFAIGTRDDPEEADYVDHLAIDSNQVIRLNNPATIATANSPNEIATVVVGVRQVEFTPDDILDSDRLWESVAGLTGPTGITFPTSKPIDDQRRQALLAGVLNGAIRQAATDPTITDPSKTVTAKLMAAVRDLGVGLRPETIRGILDFQAKSPRSNAGRLARLLLEDAFPTDLRALSGEDNGPRGVAFIGPRKAPTAAFPSRLYLATVTDDAGTRQELRFELAFPGKDNNPERYKLEIGTVVPRAPDPNPNDHKRMNFTSILTVDASGTVTVNGDLRVFADRSPSTLQGDPNGLIVTVVQPPSGTSQTGQPGQTGQSGQSGSLGAVSPLDLSIRNVDHTTVSRSPDKSVLILGAVASGKLDPTKTVYLRNTGQAPVTQVQVFATVFATDNTEIDPETTPLVRNLVVQPAAAENLHDPADPDKPLQVSIEGVALRAAEKITLVLSVYGYGPGFLLVSNQRKITFP
jgi:hypothetical protein